MSGQRPRPALDTEAIERLERINFGTRLLRESLESLWDDLPDPPDLRVLAVRGFANIVRQHTASQWLLIKHQLDVSATALVRPTYEAMLRAIWAFRGAEDDWIAGFFAPRKEAIESDAETRKGPDVVAMLEAIARHQPPHIHDALLALKEATWRGMHSYVHGGIRPVVQSFVPFPHQEAGSLLINANGMFLMTTNVVRMAHGLSSPSIPELQRQYADCVPNAQAWEPSTAAAP